MKKIVYVFLLVAFVFFTAVSAAEFKPYPGAKMDEKATKKVMDGAVAAKTPDVKPTIYTTSDSFEKVASFYKGIAKEYMMPRASGTSGKPKKLEGYDLWEAYFILDGARIFRIQSSGLRSKGLILGVQKWGKTFKCSMRMSVM